MCLKVFSPDTVHTASFGGDVKPLVPGYWLILAFMLFRLPYNQDDSQDDMMGVLCRVSNGYVCTLPAGLLETGTVLKDAHDLVSRGPDPSRGD